MEKRYHCPVELAVDVIGGRWRPVILAHLKQGAHRYGELRRRMPQVSEKMLVQRLRELEADGLVSREDFGTVPPHVEYRLTEEGASLAPVLQALYDWGTARAARTGTPMPRPSSVPAARWGNDRQDLGAGDGSLGGLHDAGRPAGCSRRRRSTSVAPSGDPTGGIGRSWPRSADTPG
ncbi:helix-turn-helix domain-containing protein [Dactylosporangium sp. NPDC050688]|uniref:winged helix-turn-helix transcriptional regulator n=1 Tax=Dactylosporangium sp. NPDC050688 TaxID=3157217 RepID=UPI0033D42E3E